jgi:hypothetical protein
LSLHQTMLLRYFAHLDVHFTLYLPRRQLSVVATSAFVAFN